MKKFLLTAALILALVTSLTAGTMAAYTNNVATITDANVTTKTWNVSATSTDAKFNEIVNLAPGDKAIYEIVVANASEVDAHIDLAYGLANGAPAGLTIVCDKAENVKLAKGDSVTYTFTVNYDYNIGVTASASTSFSITLGATSVNESNTYSN